MTATLLAEWATVLPTRDATVGAPAPAVDDLPDDYDASRDFFNGCTVSFDLPRYVFPLGPPSPLSRTLADVVREVTA